MSRPSLKLPIAVAGGDSNLTIKKSDWKRIESAYGRELSGAVREAVLKATQEFVYWEGLERSAQPAKDTKTKIHLLKSGAASFQKNLWAHAFSASDVGFYASHLIKRNFHDSRLADTNQLFNTLSGLLTSFQVACTGALSDLQTAPSFVQGECWGGWIRQLTRTLKENGLRTEVRKDAGGKSKSDKHSPFVHLVHELQNCLPNGYRRSVHSDGALAKAIVEARTKRDE